MSAQIITLLERNCVIAICITACSIPLVVRLAEQRKRRPVSPLPVLYRQTRYLHNHITAQVQSVRNIELRTGKRLPAKYLWMRTDHASVFEAAAWCGGGGERG